MTDLGTLGGEMSCAWGISATEEIVGSSSPPEGFSKAFSWTSVGGMVPLPTPPGVGHVGARRVNTAGMRVGDGFNPDLFDTKAVVWEADRTPHVLETPDGPLHYAFDLNEAGQLVGYRYRLDGTLFAYVLTPVVEPEPYPPVAAFAVSVDTGEAPLEVVFSDESSGAIDRHAWEFGDRGTSAEPSPSHTYTTPGTYMASLTVEGPGGSDSASVPIVVTAPPPPPEPEPMPPGHALRDCHQQGLRGQELKACLLEIIQTRKASR